MDFLCTLSPNIIIQISKWLDKHPSTFSPKNIVSIHTHTHTYINEMCSKHNIRQHIQPTMYVLYAILYRYMLHAITFFLRHFPLFLFSFVYRYSEKKKWNVTQLEIILSFSTRILAWFWYVELVVITISCVHICHQNLKAMEKFLVAACNMI